MVFGRNSGKGFRFPGGAGIFCLFIGAAAGFCSLFADETSLVRVCGIRVVAKPYGDRYSGLRAFNWPEGTSVGLLVTVPGGNIIKIDRRESRLDTFTDNKGSDLKKGTGLVRAGFASAAVSRDRKAVMIEAKGPGVPGQGAHRVSGSGKIIVLCSDGKKKSFEQKDIPLVKGNSFQAGEYAFEIEDVQKPPLGKFAVRVTLVSEAEYRKVDKLLFYDSDGTEIKSSRAGTSKTRIGDKVTVRRHYNLTEKKDKITVKAICWKNLVTKEVPFSFSASVGL